MQNLPLLMTRPVGTNVPFVQMLLRETQMRVEVIESPLIRIDKLPSPDLPNHLPCVIFSSANGVHFAPPGDGRRAFCIGEKTTSVAKRAGWKAEQAGQDADALVDYILNHTPPQQFTHLCGVHVRGKIAERLSAAGYFTNRIALYDQALVALSDKAKAVLRSSRPVITPLFSPRAAAHFATECPVPHKAIVVLMSDAVSGALGEFPVLQRVTASAPNALAMAACVENLVTQYGLG